MADYVDLNGVPTWYNDIGEGKPLVLLHGGLTDSRDFAGTSPRWPAGFGSCCPNAVVTGMLPTYQGRSRSR